MKILILEDNLQRLRWFRDVLMDNNSLYIASNVDKAKEYFLMNKQIVSFFIL